MAEPEAASVNGGGSAPHDGRFGTRFDDEVSVAGIVWITVGLAAACALGMWITWVMQGHYAARAEAAAPAVIAEPRMPEGPLLQRDPEGELQALRQEMSQRLGSYGWVDEGAGVVHIPIEEAMDLLLAHGSVAGAGGSDAGDAAGEAASEEPGE